MNLTTEQNNLAQQIMALMVKATEAAAPSPQPAFNHEGLNLYVRDAFVAPGDRVARVPIVLDAPAAQTIVVKYVTQNDTAVEGFQFNRAEGYAAFHPGEQSKVIAVTLKQELGAKRFRLIVGWPQNNPSVKITRGTGVISGDVAALTGLQQGAVLPSLSGLLQRPANMTLAFSETFGTGFAATDGGLKADGITPCWGTRLAHGRTQATNKEVGYYADAVINPGTTPFLTVDGKFNLQSEFFQDGVKDATGTPIPCGWDVVGGQVQPFRFSASLISTQRNFNTINVGSYVEAKLTMPRVQGCWPAFWFVATDLSWPSIEFDMFEGFFSKAGSLDQVGTTVHWKADSGAHTMFSLRLPQLGIDIAQPHVWGVYWGQQAATFFCDDVPYMTVPNVFPSKDCYLMLNIAVGGLVTKPADPATFPARMPVEWVKVWK
ncbi:family 16 glycosylhydrolase [Rhizobium sp. BK251]|uniref:family 16 glycosylhydrolase n=1 Tax=Rhizobium sp. BK251 TaxID=2512125 RepID=UPI00105335AD|nr:family 16 glycosylhydrolase [Rhizobium sp. BK251]TCL64120.1 Calx-beta domain-containing protein [Rhizobium sp. BK251]